MNNTVQIGDREAEQVFHTELGAQFREVLLTGMPGKSSHAAQGHVQDKLKAMLLRSPWMMNFELNVEQSEVVHVGVGNAYVIGMYMSFEGKYLLEVQFTFKASTCGKIGFEGRVKTIKCFDGRGQYTEHCSVVEALDLYPFLLSEKSAPEFECRVLRETLAYSILLSTQMAPEEMRNLSGIEKLTESMEACCSKLGVQVPNFEEVAA